MSALDNLLDANPASALLKNDFSAMAAKFFESSVQLYFTQAAVDLDNRL